MINVLSIILLKVLGFWDLMNGGNLYVWGAILGIGAIIQTLIILLFYRIADKKRISTLGFRFNKGDLGFSVMSIVLTVAVVLIYMFTVLKAHHLEMVWQTHQFTTFKFYLLFLAVGFGWFNAAFTEEVLFRGYLFSNLKHLSPLKLYVVTSVFFMLSHFIIHSFNPLYVLFLVVNSCTLLYVYIKIGSLIPTTFAHFILNYATNHLIGNSEIAILKYSFEPSMVHLIVITILYNILMIVLTNVFYRINIGVQLNKNANLTQFIKV